MYYESYFDLTEPPFSISPDPRYLYLTQSHREALAHLLYGVSSNGGFVLLTGEIGAGKTTVCQCLLEQLPDNTDVAYILNPKLEPWEFLAAVCDELDIDYPPLNTSIKLYVDRIHRYLLDAHGRGRNTVLMVDEAQNLGTELIEHLRLLTNLETTEKKLLQIMLIGQPELRDKLELPEMEQMAQRITARFHLGPLTRREVGAYIRHRLKIAGCTRDLFSRDCIKLIWRNTSGVPRLINIICDRSLLGTYVSNKAKVEPVIVEQAIGEVLGRRAKVGHPRVRRWLAGTAAVVIMGAAFAAAYHFRSAVPIQLRDTLPLMESNKEEPSAITIGGDTAMDTTVGEGSPDGEGGETTTGEQPLAPVQSESRVQVKPDALQEPRGADAVPAASDQTLSFPEDISTEDLETSAFKALFSSWGVTYNPQVGIQPCSFAGGAGLACLQGQGNIDLLRKLNRPASLKLYDRSGKTYHAALMDAAGETVRILMNGQPQRIPERELIRWWYGEYVVLWRVPDGYRFPLRVGRRGLAVDWVLQQLGESVATPGRSVFSAELEDRVKLFQRENGLIPDGVVGPMTIIALNRQADVDGPVLATDAGN